MPKFFTDIDLNKNELKNAAVHNVPDAPSIPSSPSVGQIYFDTNGSSGTKNRILVRNIANDAWISIPYSGSIVNADISAGANIDVTKLLTSGTNAVTLSSIGLPTGSVSFNSQSITSVNQLTTTGNVTVGGDLTVNGNTTTINTTDLNVEDKNIVIANVTSPDNDTADGAGITIKGLSDKTFTWVKATTAFTSSENLNLASGKVYEINGTTVLSSSAVLGRTPGGSGAGDIVTIDGTQILTNKTIGVSQLSGQVAIANGGTGAATTSQNYAFIGPATGGAGAPSFRALVAADLPSNVGYKYATTITASTTSAITVTHSLNTRDVIVQVYDTATGNPVNQVFTDIAVTGLNTVTVTFAVDDGLDYRVIVIG